MQERGVCPFAVWLPTQNFGYPMGRRGQNKPEFFVDHIMAGFKQTMDNPVWLNDSGISSHFAIGFDGSISQYHAAVSLRSQRGVFEDVFLTVGFFITIVHQSDLARGCDHL